MLCPQLELSVARAFEQFGAHARIYIIDKCERPRRVNGFHELGNERVRDVERLYQNFVALFSGYGVVDKVAGELRHSFIFHFSLRIHYNSFQKKSQ